MSRIGKLPIAVPKGVEIKIEGNKVSVKGPKGSLSRELHPLIRVRQLDGQILVERPDDERQSRSLHGLTRTLVNNMVVGVTTGFEKNLSMIGVGFKAALQGKALQINIGYSHPVLREPPAGIEFAVEPGKGTTKIIVKGIDKQLVGQTAAELRSIRPPEPYKGKNIRYENENVIRKMGKAGKTGK
jgi:large subunit ribosomal protein L6